MLAEITRPTAITATAQPEEPPHPITPYSLTLALAYLHYYTPKRLPNGRILAVKHLRQLAAWIGRPAPQLRSIRQHKPLAAHIAFLHAAGLLAASGSTLSPQPPITPWLHQPNLDIIHSLAQTIHNHHLWLNTLQTLNLCRTLTHDYTVYLQQSLSRQRQNPPTPIIETAIWLDNGLAETWQLTLPHSLPLWLHFDLRQIGAWSPGQPLTCTPLTIAAAIQRGRSPQTIQWLLETATRQPLPPTRQTRLNQWRRRAHAYRLRAVHLLSANHPCQMQSIFRKKYLRQAIIKQISPRHAIVTTDMARRLKPHLAQQGYLLPAEPAPESETAVAEPVAAQWLSARVLIGLGQLTPLPCPAPHSLLTSLSSQLDPIQITDLEAQAETILQNLRLAIRGQDAFFPAITPIPAQWTSAIQCAITQDKHLRITYQSLAETTPSHRTIQPFRLEKRGGLSYLYAYCYRAEANRTFRLDRIATLKQTNTLPANTHTP